ncbi:MAG TPA: hypothetical protein PKU97_14225 [Kofleriaceae bacterium]|nr:hypothetical protein [Kofleriaceae bacterium]
MRVMTNIVSAIVNDGLTLSGLLRHQQRYHEHRRWSVFEVLEGRTLEQLHPEDRAALWHAARAELTTQPAGIRLAQLGVKLANELQHDNPLGATVLHAAAAWSARYWLEEEAHHEVAYGVLLEMIGDEPIPQQEVVEHRGFFPDDNYARVCMLQACVEIEATVAYGEIATNAHDPLVREIFTRITRDEVQHKQYFVAFAQALVDAGVYDAKDVLAMAYTWVRPKGGETHGSMRAQQTKREGYVNWWERVRKDEGDDHALKHDWIRSEALQAKKVRSVLRGAAQATGLALGDVQQLQRAYFRSLARPAVASGGQRSSVAH